MKINKLSLKRKFTVTGLIIALLCCVFLGYSIMGDKRAEALNAVPTSTSVETAIYDFENYCYSESALNEMSRQILNVLGTGGTKDFTTLKTYARTTAGQRGVAIASNTVITLKYGRYRFTDKSSYKDLIWMPVYLSQSKTGDPILTLYLAATENSNGSTSQQEAGSFSHDSTYSSDQSNTAPSNSYGTSFMRTVSLGNAVSPSGDANQYATYDERHSSWNKMYNATLKESNYNKFTDFVRGSKNATTNTFDFVGTLYDDIATPSELLWQETESYAESINDSAYAGYIWPNEAYGTPASGTYYQETFFDYDRNNKINYNAWQYDKVWLPSLTEVGTGDITGDGTDTTNGIWKLTAAKRSNKINSWLRTANPTVANTGSYSTYTMFAMDRDGYVTNVDVNQTAAIRPAIHLNLNKLSDKTIAPVNLPEVVTSIYSGGFQSIAVIPEDQRKWYSAEDMTVSFYYDKDCSDGTVPLNAGEYYMMVELNSNSKRYFKGEPQSVKQKSTKFVVEKVKLGVTWTYESDYSFAIPIKVDVVGEFYERDIIAGNTPEIGMRYSNVTGAGIQNSPEWPDKIGWYTASAYIIDENLHNYNYEIIADETAESHQFEVLQKKIGQPYFLRSDTDTLKLGYKGKQYVQIGNISQYVSIDITASATGVDSSDAEANSAAALAKIVDLGIVDGIQTYIIEAVASYTFTIKLKDEINTVWDESGTDTSPRYLNLGIERAEITVSFDGLPSSWERGRAIEFELDILGVYNIDDLQELEFNVSYYINNSFVPIRVPYDAEKKKYVFRANTLDVGEYYVYAVLGGTSQWTGNYRMAEPKTQKFTIRETVSNFNASLVRWQYTVNGEVSANTYPYDLHDSENNALTVPNTASTGYYYEFALSISQQRLRDQYFVKASYTGDTYVRDAGLHSVTVVISAYDKNVIFESLTFTIYFKIEMAEFDLSNVKWNYTDPFTYSGSEYKVMIDPLTLPDGLTAEYTTGGTAGNTATNAGSYTTIVKFLVSDEYLVNYKVPAATDYTGIFPFVLNWEIGKKEITASWDSDNPSGEIFFVPKLHIGHNFVDYTYEHFENGAYTPCTGITSTNNTEKYRVTANLKSLYAPNYALTGENSCEFEVAAGQFAVTVYTEVNGTRYEDGAEFVFNGSAFTVKPAVGNGSVTISNYNVTYTDANGPIDGAPVNHGTYCANISVTFSSGNGVTFQNQTQFNFTVKKADVDTSSIRWTYTHGDTYLEVRYDADQQKWVDLNGKELNFAFEYDGTEHKLQLVGDESVSGMTISNIQDVTATNAGSHTAYLVWSINENYNEPEFPRTFAWSVVPAKVNFENVKWGYIDEHGVEHEFASDDYSFLFTRDDDKNAVPYTVALINLPDHIKSLFSYTTTSQTDRDFGTVSGNSFFRVAEYHTEVSVSGTWTDPSGNTEPFSADKFPANILRFIDWEIKARELTAPNYDGSWTIFDDKDHNLIELTGIPENELNYLNIEITFVDKANTIYNNFEGYNGIPYNAHDAGTYIVRFYELVDEVVNGEPVVNNYILWQVEVEVGKEELEVIWDKNGSIPVARVKGIYVSEMLGTAYYIVIKDENGEDKKGAKVDLTYIESTDGEVTFMAEPVITAKYDKNLTFVMANNESRTITFWHEKYVSTDKSVQLDKPIIETVEIEYTGNPITFKISNWDALYKNYLYISDGDLTQTEIGEYTVRISFIKEADAYWFGTADDRSYVDLDFKIIPPTRQPLGYPLFDKYSVEYTGATHEFRITNWVELQRYVDYEVFYQGQSQGTNLSHSRAGVYTVVFKFKEGSIGYWANDPDNPKKDYTVQFEIVDPNASEQEIMNPTLQTSSKPYTGSAVEFTVDKWDSYYAAYLEISGFSDGVTVNGGTFSAVNVGSYDVYLSIKTEGVTFSGGATTCTLTFVISAPDPGSNIKVPLQKPVLSADSQPYTGNIVEFKIANWESIGYANYLEIICDNENVSVSGGVIKAVEAGTYKITVKFKDGANAEWLDGSTGSFELSFTITESGEKPGTPTVLPSPSLMEKTHEFNGNEITFVIKNWEIYSNYVEIVEGSLTQINAGVYTVILRLKDTNAAVWEGGLTTDIPLTFEITAATLIIDKDENGNIVIKNSSGDIVNIDDYLDIKYFDPDTGEEVPVEDLVDGKTYKVQYSVKEDKKETFIKNVENAGDVIKNFEENTYNITYVKPSGGLNLVIIIIIVSAVVLLILIVATIIVIKKRRDSYEYYDEADENYDEYEDYDDYDEYDDGYDDYDDYDEYDDDEY